MEAAGREVRITSPHKVFFPERGETKLDLVRYYLAIEESLMRTMGGRPVLMQRFPEGAGGPDFFQKRVPNKAPDWLQTTTVSTVNGTPSQALVAADVAHVVWAVNLTCLGFHVWPTGRRRGGGGLEPRHETPTTPTSCAWTSIPSRAPASRRRRGRPSR